MLSVVRRAMRLPGGLPDPDGSGKPLRIKHPLQERPVDGPPLLVAHRTRSPLGIGKGGIASRGPDEPEQVGEHVIHAHGIEPKPFQRPKLMLVFRALPRPQRRPTGRNRSGPRMLPVQQVVLPSDDLKPGAPIQPVQPLPLHPPEQEIKHQSGELALAGNIRVQGHRSLPELLGQPPHGHGLQPLGIGQRNGGRDHLVNGQPLPGPAARFGSGSPEQLKQVRLRRLSGSTHAKNLTRKVVRRTTY
ncbi:hypothetical protein B0I28_104349 [Glycomyces artemisiae]|uniref:Uncharacterized protein n=1 Tax=Glycomyces artemisiae TaxID=1076443 RepID=A0A2T0UMN4_9ACTN|nr:hypothetical protein B0I28_104349 [Glycomyces artemisiae]